MVNLELYRIFKVVAEQENLTRASEILLISQPAVTKHIKNLENEINVKLFTRSKYGMILNENGKKLYDKIKNSIEIVINAEKIFNEHRNINMGVHVNMPKTIYSDAILKYYEINKQSIINIHSLTAINMFSMLKEQKIDIAFSKKYSEEIYDSSEIKFIKIGELHDTFIVNANSKYLNKKITKEDLRKIAETKLPDLNAYDVESAMVIIAGTARNMGIAIKGYNDAELEEQAAEAKKEEAQRAKRETELAELEAEAQEMAEATSMEIPEENEETAE